jgi:hypothetical protein
MNSVYMHDGGKTGARRGYLPQKPVRPRGRADPQSSPMVISFSRTAARLSRASAGSSCMRMCFGSTVSGPSNPATRPTLCRLAANPPQTDHCLNEAHMLPNASTNREVCLVPGKQAQLCMMHAIHACIHLKTLLNPKVDFAKYTTLSYNASRHGPRT